MTKSKRIEDYTQDTIAMPLPVDEAGDNHKNQSVKSDYQARTESTTKLYGDGEAELNNALTEAACEAVESASPPETSVNYKGVVDLVITPPVEIPYFVRLCRNLLNVDHVRILSTDGSCDQESVIKIYIERPIPLTQILMDIPEVQEAKLLNEDELVYDEPPWGWALRMDKGDMQEKQVVVTFNLSND